MKVEIETTTALPELRDVYNYLKSLKITNTRDKDYVERMIEKGKVQSKVYVVLKKLEWAIEDKIKEVDTKLDFLREEAEDIKIETKTSFIKEGI